ncbi:MAG: hypothetical protein GY835_26660 [bacterium]|nr:hypothetical protein [bacterium]
MIRHLLILTSLLLVLAGCGGDSSTKPSGPQNLPPAYAIQYEFSQTAILLGWAKLDEVLDRNETVITGRYNLPGDPYISRIEFLFDNTGDSPVYDIDIGPANGPFIATRVARENGGPWAWCLGGWGELNLAHDIAPATGDPIYFDPLNPFSYAQLAWHWQDEGGPASLEVNLLYCADPEGAPEHIQRTLVYDGLEMSGSIEVEAFHLVMGDTNIFFKFIADRFPLLYRSFRESDHVSLTYWNATPPDLTDQEFSPTFPDPEQFGEYSTSTITTDGSLQLAGTLYLPAGDGPFPGVLLIADHRLADRNGGAVMGHLAHELVMQGRIVLACDKPGSGGSTGISIDELDLVTRRGELAEAWSYLLSHTLSIPESSVIIGHGEGAALALEYASENSGPAGVIALSCPLYDPTRLPDLVEAQGVTGYIDMLGKSLFVDKYNDLLAFDSAAFLPAVDGPVAFWYGEEDDEIAVADFLTQVGMLNNAGIMLTTGGFPDLNHYLTSSRQDGRPHQEVISAITSWLAANLP